MKYLRLGVALVLVLGACAARAVPITYNSTPLSLDFIGPDSGTFSLPQLDPGLGTLTGVTLTLTYSESSSVTFNALAQGTYQWHEGNRLSVLDSGSQVLASDSFSWDVPLQSIAANPGVTVNSPAFPFSHQVNYPQQGPLDAFLGSGQLQFAAEFIHSFDASGTSGNVWWSQAETATFSATITYEVVPEPAIPALLVLGGLGFLARRLRVA